MRGMYTVLERGEESLLYVGPDLSYAYIIGGRRNKKGGDSKWNGNISKCIITG